MKTATLTNKEDRSWEEVYNQLVKWGIHEDFTHDLWFAIIKTKFERLKDVRKPIEKPICSTSTILKNSNHQRQLN